MARGYMSVWALRDRHLLWICLGAAASLLLPDPHWGIAAMLLLPVSLLDTSKDGAISISSTDQQGLQLSRERTAWSPYWLKLP